LKTFGETLGKRLKSLNDEQSLLKRGIMKIEETNTVVVDMEKELTSLKPILHEKAEQGKILLAELESKKGVMEEAKKSVEEESAVVQKNADIADEIAAQAKVELDAALPMLKGATDAVEVLKSKKGELAAVETYKNPPTRVRMVMSAVCQLTGFPTDWKGGQKFLAQPNNMAILADLHNQQISENDLKKIQVYNAQIIGFLQFFRKRLNEQFFGTQSRLCGGFSGRLRDRFSAHCRNCFLGYGFFRDRTARTAR
jgi:dynein heavy chain